MTILEQVTARRPLSRCHPVSTRELFALRLAQKLREPAVAGHYIALTEEHTPETLLVAYRRACKRGEGADLGRKFHEELLAIREQSPQPYSDRVLAIKVERRSVAIAVFVGQTLDFHDTRTLSSQVEKAERSALGFLNWVISNFAVESAALEPIPVVHGSRRASLSRQILHALRSQTLLPVWEVSKQELLHAYAHPALRSRDELRKAVHRMLWSMFNTERPGVQELDAAALGLYVQVERQFL